MTTASDDVKRRILLLLSDLERKIAGGMEIPPEVGLIRREILRTDDGEPHHVESVDVAAAHDEFQELIAAGTPQISWETTDFTPALRGVGWYPITMRSGRGRAWSGTQKTATLILPLKNDTIWCKLKGRFASAEQAGKAAVVFSLNGRGIPSVKKIVGQSYEMWLNVSADVGLTELALHQDNFVKDVDGKDETRQLGLRLDEVTLFAQSKRA